MNELTHTLIGYLFLSFVAGFLVCLWATSVTAKDKAEPEPEQQKFYFHEVTGGELVPLKMYTKIYKDPTGRTETITICSEDELPIYAGEVYTIKIDMDALKESDETTKRNDE